MGRRSIPVSVIVSVLVLAACANDAATTTTRTVTSTTATPDTTEATPPRPSRPTGVPDVDLTLHDVPLDEVVFDTFDGGFVPLPESSEELRASLRDAIPPLDRPRYEAGDETDWLANDDLVVGYLAGDQAYAYPVRILNSHEIVNDDLDATPVLVTYCPLCRSGVVYDRRIGGREPTFSNTSALHEADLVMVDRETGSYWWQVAGRSIVGELTGSSLTALPSELAHWSDWLDRHPGTLVLSRETGFDRRYERDNFSRYGEAVAAGDFAFPVGEAARDDRLGAADIVVAVTVNGRTVAYATDRLEDPFVDDIDGVMVTVTPHVFGASVLRADGEPLGARTAFWFAVASAFPDVEVRMP